MYAHLEAGVQVACNEKVARYQSIKKIVILPRPFSVETGELTPSMKVNRKSVIEAYDGVISGLY